MVGQEDDERVAPLRCLLKGCNEFAYTVVKVSHGIGFLVAGNSVVWHAPRLMRGERKKRGVPWRRSGGPVFQVVQQVVEHNAVGNAPSVGNPFLCAEMRVARYFFVPRGAQVALHVRKVDVSAIEEIGGITGILQRFGD